MGDFRDYKNVVEDRDEPAQYFCRFTFGQFFTILVLEVITLGFVFYLGAKYGNEYIKISQETATPAVTEIVAGVPNVPAQSVIHDPELQAMAKDAIQGGGEPDLKQRVKELLEKESSQPATTALAGKQGAVSGERLATPAETSAGLPAKTIKQEQAAESPKPANEGVVRMKSPANAQFSIQVGSYPNMDEANQKVSEWRDKGYAAFMMIADIADRGRWYRVRVGGFATKEDAQSYMDQLTSKENTEAIIVRNEQ